MARKKKTIPSEMAQRRARRRPMAGHRGTGQVQGFGHLADVERGARGMARRRPPATTHNQNTPPNMFYIRAGRGVTTSHNNMSHNNMSHNNMSHNNMSPQSTTPNVSSTTT